jgi:ElaB/YqjD/DUF883 family membrane-anchored ribosome-binding protein
MAQASNELQSKLETAVGKESAPEEIREQMAETRAALTEKLETLQERMEGTVETAHTTVENTVYAVKEGIHETVETVKRTFDLEYQVEQRPWLMMGAAVLAGYALGAIGHAAGRRGLTSEGAPPRQEGADDSPPVLRTNEESPGATSVTTHSSGGRPALSRFDEEIDKLRSIVIGAAMGVVREWLKESMPSVSGQLEEVMDTATRKLGGVPTRSPVVHPTPRVASDTEG